MVSVQKWPLQKWTCYEWIQEKKFPKALICFLWKPLLFCSINKIITILLVAELLCNFTKYQCSDAASEWAGWALAHPEFGSSVNPIKTRGQILPTNLLLAHPELKTQRHSAIIEWNLKNLEFWATHLLSKSWWYVRDAAGFSNPGGLAVMWWSPLL